MQNTKQLQVQSTDSEERYDVRYFENMLDEERELAKKSENPEKLLMKWASPQNEQEQ